MAAIFIPFMFYVMFKECLQRFIDQFVLKDFAVASFLVSGIKIAFHVRIKIPSTDYIPNG